jgi:hypothetical protein
MPMKTLESENVLSSTISMMTPSTSLSIELRTPEFHKVFSLRDTSSHTQKINQNTIPGVI